MVAGSGAKRGSSSMSASSRHSSLRNRRPSFHSCSRREPRTREAAARRAEHSNSDQLGGRSQYLLAQLAIARQRRWIHADVFDLRRLEASLLDDLQLLVARILNLLGFLGID